MEEIVTAIYAAPPRRPRAHDRGALRDRDGKYLAFARAAARRALAERTVLIGAASFSA